MLADFSDSLVFANDALSSEALRIFKLRLRVIHLANEMCLLVKNYSLSPAQSLLLPRKFTLHNNTVP